MNTPAKHATIDQMAAISTAHTATAGQFLARVLTVRDALAVGTDVKTLAADMAAESTKATKDNSGRVILALGQATLGKAKAVGTVWRETGLTLPATADEATPAEIDAIVAAYRAIDRHGVTVGTRDLKADMLKGKAPAAKLTAATKRGGQMVADAVATRKAKAKPSTRVVAGKHTAASILKGMAERVTKGTLTPDAEFRAALALLVETVAATPAKVIPTPATVPAAKVPAKA